MQKGGIFFCVAIDYTCRNHMAYDFSSLKKDIQETEDWFVGELSSIRTGRASAVVLDGIRVDSYGAKVPVSHIAGVTTEDAKTLRITPWDKGLVKEIEHAVAKADLGVSVVADSEGLRVIFPELTGERRETFIKIARAKAEETRKRLRRVRDEVWGDIQEKERTGVITEDEKFRFKDDMQKMVDAANTRIGELVEKKEKEIMS